MSLLVKRDLAPTREPKHSKTLPGRLVSGDPSYKTWEQDSSRGDSVKTGVWEARLARTARSRARPSSTATSFPAWWS